MTKQFLVTVDDDGATQLRQMIEQAVEIVGETGNTPTVEEHDQIVYGDDPAFHATALGIAEGSPLWNQLVDDAEDEGYCPLCDVFGNVHDPEKHGLTDDHCESDGSGECLVHFGRLVDTDGSDGPDVCDLSPAHPDNRTMRLDVYVGPLNS